MLKKRERGDWENNGDLRSTNTKGRQMPKVDLDTIDIEQHFLDLRTVRSNITNHLGTCHAMNLLLALDTG